MQNRSAGRRKPRPVSELLKAGDSTLGRLLARAREIERLDQKLARLLDPDVAARVRVAVRRDHRLVLLTPSAALATRLRMDSGQILQGLHRAGEKAITELSVRVAPIGRADAAPRRRRELSDSARHALERFADDSGDPEVRAIIRHHRARRNGES
jgi:hypothetical protein